VWSMVGNVVGLGDRHGENILIDEKNGECVHVDFDCLFGKGLTLEKPEIVPFRLTPNIVDALGVTGVEGLFRRSCEISMGVLRANQETLMSVLATFIYDPLVEWKSRSDHRSDGSKHREEMKPLEITNKIKLKLRGHVDIEGVPQSLPLS